MNDNNIELTNDISIDERLRVKILENYKKLEDNGEITPIKELNKYYDNFRERFAPEVLQNLDGSKLLNRMFGNKEDDSMTYWLEFKNDEEFNTRDFGGISGGSALKFGIFKRKNTDDWMTKDKSNYLIKISENEAISIAIKIRDEIIKSHEIIDRIIKNKTLEEYRELDKWLNDNVSDIYHYAWYHKYMAMISPDKISIFHTQNLQKFFLVKSLANLSKEEMEMKYLCSGYFVVMADRININLVHFCNMLTNMYGSPISYWRIGTKSGSTNESYWEEMKSNGFASLGCKELGDLSTQNIKYDTEGIEVLREKFISLYNHDKGVAKRKAKQYLSFYDSNKISENDIIVAKDGNTVLGIGRIIGDYYYDDSSDFPHKRPVRWLSFDKIDLPNPSEGNRTTVYEIKDYNNKIAIESSLLSNEIEDNSIDIKETDIKADNVKLEGIQIRIQNVLERKKQIILYGPPGTGKTYWAERTVKDLSKMYNKNDNTSEYIDMCTFHPNYGYEDFIEGYKPKAVNGQIVFELEGGIFKRVCNKAKDNPNNRYYLIIDEINRGDIPRIFGELLTLLEKNKRGKNIKLPLSKTEFHVPDNVYVIGTMNTADRSIALLDTALRRRFGFIELMPDTSIFDDIVIEKTLHLGKWLEDLNMRIVDKVGRDARNLQIGHSYFMENDKPIDNTNKFLRIIQEDIIPLLEEYCYEDYNILEELLGKTIVDSRTQKINYKVFNLKEEAVKGLLESSSETIKQIITNVDENNEDEEAENEDDTDSDEEV